MNKLIFYHQKRRDSGIRTGVELNGERILEQFEPGDPQQDSALLWFVDVRCSGERIPSQPEEVRQWLMARSDEIRAGLSELSNELIAGIDREWPLKKELPSADGVNMAIYCSAIQRLSGREISSILSDLANRWTLLVQNFGAYEPLVPFNA